jgi:ribonuclease P protein component
MSGFTKYERLCSRKAIQHLFETGLSFNVPPFRVLWMKAESGTPYPARIAISIPKTAFRKAVQRNLLRRRIREAYRKNKHFLYEYLSLKSSSLVFILLYSGKEIIPYRKIENKIIVTLQRLIEAYEKNNS